jgi:hypothetical protein
LGSEDFLPNLRCENSFSLKPGFFIKTWFLLEGKLSPTQDTAWLLKITAIGILRRHVPSNRSFCLRNL